MNNKQNIISSILILSFLFVSCFNKTLNVKKLNLKVIENQSIKIEQYDISEITTVHEFIDITNKRWNIVERIYEGNTESIDHVFVRNDTIFLTTQYDNPIIYDLSAIKFGYKIELIKE